jgi:hypothetical protein
MMEKCKWTKETDDWGDPHYFTVCGQGFDFSEGTPAENGFRYCPFCGRRIEADDE